MKEWLEKNGKWLVRGAILLNVFMAAASFMAALNDGPKSNLNIFWGVIFSVFAIYYYRKHGW